MNKVYLVGAGPGDPELITIKGRRLLEHADTVLYDHLANPSLLSLAPARAEKIYVGKKRAQQAYTQQQIIEMMIDRARGGLNVVRLKGGDPFIFGRGGEEVEGLAAAGIAYEVVPGVTAPLGIAAYTGVPLTHREHTSVVTFVTGHDLNAVNWKSVAGSETLVVFMGLQHLPEIVNELMRAGRRADTPAMAVQWGTRPFQRTVQGALSALPELVQASHLAPPATVIIGDVVALRERLTWYEKLPLHGKQVVVTRARAQSADLVTRLVGLGADVVEIPVIELVAPEDWSELDACIARIASYDWLVFTSTNAVDFFFSRFDDMRKLRARICAIGAATAEALRTLRLPADLVPDQSTSEGIAAAFRGFEMKGTRVLFPRAAVAREAAPAALIGMGASVDAPVAYRNILPADAEERIRTYAASGGRSDWILFTSPSTVSNFLAAGGAGLLESTRIASIGPSTSEAVRAHGLAVHVESEIPSAEALAEAVAAAVQV